ncbi:MAG TPA: MAPEG family protein [Nevskiaceae bacterium]|nr:MAPEG family protein [Nevskiaceae bacterium]
MNQGTILEPMTALALWTLGVLTLIPVARFRAGRAGLVRTSDFRFGESANVPPHVSIPNRNLMNLLELPVLFYALCLALYATHLADHTALVLAWGYVVLRMMHSLIHLSYNRVVHRLSVFAVSNLVLTAMWLRFLWVLPST